MPAAHHSYAKRARSLRAHELPKIMHPAASQGKQRHAHGVEKVTSATAGSELRDRWPLVLACGTGFGLGLSGLPFYTYGVFVGPLRETFGWNMAIAQGGLTVNYLATIVTIPMTGWLADRFGARALVLPSLVLFSLSFMLLSLLNGGTAQFFALWALVSATGTGTLALTWSRALSGAFNKARGLALGLALLGSGVAGFVGPPLARWLIEAFGWRVAYVTLGALPLLIALPMAYAFLRDLPASVGTMATSEATGATLRDALRHPRFWLIALAFFLIGAGVTGMLPNLIKILTETGMTIRQAVFAVSLVGLFVIFGRVLCGALLDRFWGPGVAFAFLVLPAISCLMLSGSAVGLLTAAGAAALMGLATGAEFDLLPYLVGRYFGLARFGAILGVLSAIFYLGAAVGAPMVGRMYDRVGSYAPGLVAIGAAFAASAILLLFLGRYPAAFAPPSEPVGAPH